MLRWESLPVLTDEQVGQDADARAERDSVIKMRKVTVKLVDLVNQGYEARRSDPGFIRDTIIEMSKGAGPTTTTCPVSPRAANWPSRSSSIFSAPRRPHVSHRRPPDPAVTWAAWPSVHSWPPRK